ELNLTKVMVSEAGASVYSASAYAARELPDLDVSLRDAVSIARRLQAPLAELVKIEPRSIGVGQSQHALPELALSRALGAVAADPRVGYRLRAGGVDRAAPRDERTVPLAHGVEGCSPARAEGLRTMRRVPAYPRR